MGVPSVEVTVGRVYGQPVAGGAQTLAFDATDKSITLSAGQLYVLVASSDAFLGAADITVAGNRAIYLPAGVQYAMQIGATDLVLHAGQVSLAGTLYAGKVREG